MIAYLTTLLWLWLQWHGTDVKTLFKEEMFLSVKLGALVIDIELIWFFRLLFLQVLWIVCSIRDSLGYLPQVLIQLFDFSAIKDCLKRNEIYLCNSLDFYMRGHGSQRNTSSGIRILNLRGSKPLKLNVFTIKAIPWGFIYCIMT